MVRSAWFAARVGTLVALLVSAAPTSAGEGTDGDPQVDVELVCLTEQPAIVEGESATLRAWVRTRDGQPINTPVIFVWEVDAGRIESQESATRWDLTTVNLGTQNVRKVVATVRTTEPNSGELRCAVEVFIGKSEAAIPDRGTIRGESLLSARRYLLPGEVEAPGYGLYSYLLLSAPPKDAEETARYLKTIEAYLLVLQDVDDYLARHVRRSSLNATYIPLRRAPEQGQTNAEWAANVLAVYDYAAAQIVLSRVHETSQQGPFLLSVLPPLSDPIPQAYLWEDLTGVVPDLAWNWMKFFTFLAAQERSWSEDSLRRFGLNLRNLVAVGGKVTPDVMNALEEAIKFMPRAAGTSG
jgi:hypothetical protein